MHIWTSLEGTLHAIQCNIIKLQYYAIKAAIDLKYRKAPLKLANVQSLNGEINKFFKWIPLECLNKTKVIIIIAIINWIEINKAYI